MKCLLCSILLRSWLAGPLQRHGRQTVLDMHQSAEELTCGPMLAQYQPKLCPLIHANPLPQPRTLTKVSGRCPCRPSSWSEPLIVKVPLPASRAI